MRLVFALVLLTVSATGARADEDRYGPAATAAQGAPGGRSQGYAGPMLGWSGKVAPPTAQGQAGNLPPRPQMLPGGLYRRNPPPAGGPAPVLVAPAAYRPAPAPGPQAPLAPQSLYDHPVGAQADTLPPPPATALPARGNPYAASGARFYSVHRAFGDQPDPITATPARPGALFGPEVALGEGVLPGGVGDAGAQEEPRPPRRDRPTGGAADRTEP